MQYNYSNNTNYVSAERNATTLLQSYFSSAGLISPGALISIPTFSYTPDRVIIQLYFYAAPNTFNAKNITPIVADKFNVSTIIDTLSPNLSSLFSTVDQNGAAPAMPGPWSSVPVELRIVRVHHPYFNASILAQYLVINAFQYRFALLRTWVINGIPLSDPKDTTLGNILGVKVQVAGLLTTRRAAPRKTVSTITAGTFHGDYSTVEYATHTTKSRLGSYTVKVWLCVR